MIPVDIGGKFVNQPIVYEKSQALKLMVENTDYLTRFHGEDGYMHYATLAGVENLTEEEVKKRMEFTIKNYSKWLMNGDGTGIVLNAEFTTGTYPVVNANGDKIEFFFRETPNDKNIYGIELKAPVTGENIELIPYTSDVGAYEFEETNYDNTSENKNLINTAIDSVSRVIDTAGDLLISNAAAAEIEPKIFNNPGNIEIGQGYAGETGKKYAERFAVFDSKEMGIRALALDLKTKIKRHNGIISEIFKEYAPSSENNTSSYIKFVEKKLGKKKITLNDISALVEAVIIQENKKEIADLYLEPSVFDVGIKLSNTFFKKGTTLEEALKKIK